MSEKILDVQNLNISFFTHVGEVKAVRGIDIRLGADESLGIVGESGCGKSVTSLGIMGLIPKPGQIVDGAIRFAGEDLLKKSNKEMRAVRGNDIAMIFQDPLTSLNPVYTIGNQIEETLKEHNKAMTKAQRLERTEELLTQVGIPDAKARIKQYPHEFSGGMRQRAMIAVAMANNPKLLIADEPTTALDVTIQAQILDLMKNLRRIYKTSVILITHDLGVVAGLCDYIKVMYAGKIVEEGERRDIFYTPSHPYTLGLLNSIPRISAGTRGRLVPIEGQPPDLIAPPKGCAFCARCKYAMRICKEEQPPDFTLGGGREHRHIAACWLHHPQAASSSPFTGAVDPRVRAEEP